MLFGRIFYEGGMGSLHNADCRGGGGGGAKAYCRRGVARKKSLRRGCKEKKFKNH